MQTIQNCFGNDENGKEIQLRLPPPIVGVLRTGPGGRVCSVGNTWFIVWASHILPSSITYLTLLASEMLASGLLEASKKTRSAIFPTSREPRSLDRPSALAPAAQGVDPNGH